MSCVGAVCMLQLVGSYVCMCFIIFIDLFVFCFALAGLVTTLAGSGSSAYADGQGTQASFSWPYGVAVDSMGTVYVGEYNSPRIRMVTSAGERSGRWTWTICLLLVLFVVLQLV